MSILVKFQLQQNSVKDTEVYCENKFFRRVNDAVVDVFKNAFQRRSGKVFLLNLRSSVNRDCIATLMSYFCHVIYTFRR